MNIWKVKVVDNGNTFASTVWVEADTAQQACELVLTDWADCHISKVREATEAEGECFAYGKTAGEATAK